MFFKLVVITSLQKQTVITIVLLVLSDIAFLTEALSTQLIIHVELVFYCDELGMW